MGGAVLSLIASTGYGEVCGHAVGFVRFTEELEVLSSAVLNGGPSTSSAVFIMQVPKDYWTDDPLADAVRVRDELGLPEDTVGMMTAAEIDWVFNLQEVTYGDCTVVAIATAGLSNHVVAGDVLDDYEEKSLVSIRRANNLHAGTINTCVVSPVPLSDVGKVNLFIPMVEAKSAAMADHGYVETGTTSDSIAIFSPKGDNRINYTGTGSDIGIAAARAVRAAVNHALDRRDEHPIPLTPTDIMRRMDVTPHDMYVMSGEGVEEEEFYRNLRGIFERDDVSSAMDLAWFVSKHTDSIVNDGDTRQLDVVLNCFSQLLGVPPSEDRFLMGGVLRMIATKAGER